MKKIYFLLALVLSALTANAEKLYMNAGQWASDSPVFNTWHWAAGAEGAWATFEHVGLLSDYYVADIVDNAEGVILFRRQENTQDWSTYWNRTQNVYLSGNNCVTFSAWGNKDNSTFSTSTITSVYPQEIYVISSTNAGADWDLTTATATLTATEDGVYEGTFSIAGSTGAEYVIITSVLGGDKNDWTTVNPKRVGPSANNTELVAGEQQALIATENNSWKVANDGDGRDVTVKVNLPNKTLEVIGLTTGIEEVGAEIAAPAVYYNLQGVKVDNPENGIFIKKQGGKAVKVVL